jgi:hypothetical protein
MTSEAIRRLYALDIEPISRTELAMGRAVITETASKLDDELPLETFVEFDVPLSQDESIRLLDGISVEDGDVSLTPPPRLQRKEQGPALIAGLKAPELGVRA